MTRSDGRGPRVGREKKAANPRGRRAGLGPFRVERNEHGAHLVMSGGCALAAAYDRPGARALAERLALDPEAALVAEVAAALPSGTKVWHGAAGAVVARARGYDATDYAEACWWLWSKVREARASLDSSADGR